MSGTKTAKKASKARNSGKSPKEQKSAAAPKGRTKTAVEAAPKNDSLSKTVNSGAPAKRTEDAPAKAPIHIDAAYTLELTLKLLCTCLVVAGLLGLVNLITAPRIAELTWAKTVAAMQAVVADPDSAEFSDALELTDDMSAAASGAGAQLSAVYPVSENGEEAGYAVTVVASGSQGNIEMMVGVDADSVVTGVSIVKNSETPGIGSKVMGNENTANGVGVLDQFVGKSAEDGTLVVGSNVDAITGATVSSRGVTAGVNAALAVAAALA